MRPRVAPTSRPLSSARPLSRSSADLLRPPAVRPRRPLSPRLPDDNFDAQPLPGEVLDFRQARREQLRAVREGRRAPSNRARQADAIDAMSDALPEPSLRLVREIEALESRPVAPAKAPSPCEGKIICQPCHFGLCVLTLLLTILSVPIVYSASTAIGLEHHGNANFFLWRQIGFVATGLAVLWAVSRSSSEKLRSLVWVLYFGSLLGLLAVDFTPLGQSLGGVKRWLKIGPIQLQMSEFAKIALIGVLADFWSRVVQKDQQRALWPWLVTGALSLPVIALVFVQPHLSAALLLVLLPGAIAFYAGAPIKQLAKVAGVLVAFGILGVGAMKPYQRERVMSHFMAQESDRAGARDGNYQALQGQRALVHGGLVGQGFGFGFFKHGHLPAPHTDFILASTGEEIGFMGMLLLLGCYGLIIFFCFHTGHCSRDGFQQLLCAGVGTVLAIQFIGNAGVVTGVLPVTGMPLPILSYGGSGLIATLLGIGLVLGISRGHNEPEVAEEEEGDERQLRIA